MFDLETHGQVNLYFSSKLVIEFETQKPYNLKKPIRFNCTLFFATTLKPCQRNYSKFLREWFPRGSKKDCTLIVKDFSLKENILPKFLFVSLLV